ncbi:MAG: DUF305 domain-containing protein [Acidimicrobiales bacterium]
MTATTSSAPPSPPDPPGEPAPDVDERPRRSWLVRGVVAVLAFSFLGGAVGYAVGVHQDETPSNAVDVGFLTDMSDHHDQAVTMALSTYNRTTDPTIRSFAQDVLIFQRYELGLMSAYLADRGAVRPDYDADRPAMAWMGHTMTAGTMTGMATDDQLAALAAATGPDLDLMFLDLMTAHHQGGIEMADFAAAHAADPRVRTLAERMASVQTSEVQEFDQYRAKIAP